MKALLLAVLISSPALAGIREFTVSLIAYQKTSKTYDIQMVNGKAAWFKKLTAAPRSDEDSQAQRFILGTSLSAGVNTVYLSFNPEAQAPELKCEIGRSRDDTIGVRCRPVTFKGQIEALPDINDLVRGAKAGAL